MTSDDKRIKLLGKPAAMPAFFPAYRGREPEEQSD